MESGTTYTVNKSAVVVVTGASGYIAGELLRQLFERGYTQVRGTVRNLSDERKVKHLREAFPRLELFEADLLAEGSFDAVCQGAEYVFHTASPFQVSVANPQTDLIDPAVNGTLNVLRACEKAGSVKRIVVTSSVAATARETPLPEGYRLSEKDWNTESNIQNNPYRLSKRMAEEAAWDFIKKHKEERGGSMQLVTVLPSFVIGPPLSARTDATSIATVKNALSGAWAENGAPPSAFGVVDVRDVANGHILAMEKPEANGRYLLTSADAVPHVDLCRYLKESDEFKDYPIPTTTSAPIGARFAGTHQRALDLGVTFRDPKESILDMARAMVSLGIVSKPQDK